MSLPRLVLLAALLAAPLLAVAWWKLGPGAAALITEARSQLERCGQVGTAERNELAAQAEWRLRRYLDHGGDETAAAGLLLAAALLVQHKSEPAQTLFDGADLSRISARDLTTAAAICFGAGQFGLADKLISRALELPGEDRERVLRTAATIRYDLGRDEEVLAHCRELVQLAPQDSRPWLVMAYVYEDQGYADHLVGVYRKLMVLVPDQAPQFRLKLVGQLIKTGSIDEAEAELGLITGEDLRETIEYQLAAAELLKLRGDTGRALASVERVLASAPREPEALRLRGELLVSREEFEEAVRTLQRAVESDPTNMAVHYALSRALAQQGKREQAQEHLELHRRLLSAKVRIHRLERQAGRAPGDVQVRLELARLYSQIGVSELARFWQNAAQAARALGDDARRAAPSTSAVPAPAGEDEATPAPF